MSYSSAKILTLTRPAKGTIAIGAGDIAAVAVETDVDAMEREWRAFEKTAAGHIYQSFEWISAWRNTIGRSQNITPLIVTGRTGDGKLIFLLPLGVSRRFGLTVMRWLGGREADLKGGLFDPEFLARVTDIEWNHLWDRIRALFPGIDVIHLTDQPERIGQTRNPFVLWRTHPQPDQTHGTRLGRDWKTYYDAKRGKESRRQDRRKSSKIEALGKLELVIIRDGALIPTTLDKLIADKAKTLGRMGVNNPFDAAQVRDFLSRQADHAYPGGNAHLSVITLNGEPIAGVWGLVSQKRFYYLMSSYDLEYAYYAPGTRHLQQLMRWCIDNGIDYFDFGVGNQDYKFEWCEDHVSLFATVHGRGILGRLAALAFGVKASLKHGIKTSKVLWPLAQRTRALVFSRLRRPADEP